MKQRLLFILLAMLSAATAGAAVNDEFTVDNIKYIVISEIPTCTVTLSSVETGYAPTTVVIPTTVSNGSADYYVTAISGNAFLNCTSLTSVSIPLYVTEIPSSAFSGCTNLTSVSFDGGSQLGTIGYCAFYNCSSLTSFIIPSSVTTIDPTAFDGCTSVEHVYCYADPTGRGWNFSSNFRTSYSPSTWFHWRVGTDYSGTTGGYVQFFTDLVGTAPLIAKEAAAGEYWASYYNGTQDVKPAISATVYTGKLNSTKTSVTLTEISDGIITKNQGVVLKSTSILIPLLTSSTASTDDYTDNELKGVDVATPQATGSTYYVMSKPAGKDFGFYKLASGTNLGANKAYLEVTGGSPARDFIGFGSEETTSVSSLTPGPIPEQSSPTRSLSPRGEGSIYTLDGRRVLQPTKRGVYVRDGKKVIK